MRLDSVEIKSANLTRNDAGVFNIESIEEQTVEEDIFLALQDYEDKPLAYFPSGNPAARLGLTMSFYFGAPGTPARRRALVHCVEQYLQQARGMLRVYRVCGDRRYRQLKPNDTPDMNLVISKSKENSPFWFEASGAERDGISHNWSIGALARNIERATYLGYMILSYPLSIMQTSGWSLQAFVQQFVSFCDALQVEHAYGGLGLVLPFDAGGTRAARRLIGPIAIRCPGLDVDDPTGIIIHCEEGIKSVNFLTAVSDRLLARVDGAESMAAKAGPGITMYRYSTGAVFQAGPTPEVGYDPHAHEGKPPEHYVALGRVLKPIRAPYHDTMIYDLSGGDNKAFTQRWLARFDGDQP